MLELLFGFVVVVFLLSLGIGLLKLVFGLVLLPIKLAFWLVKGLLVLVVGLPVALAAGAVLFGAVVPLAALLLLAPLWLLGAIVVAIAH